MEWVKILSGASSARMLNGEHGKFVSIVKSDTRPGDGWYPVEKVLPKPVPSEGEELGYTYTLAGDVMKKEYFVVRTNARRWSRLSIKGALADAHMLPAAKAFLSEFEVKPDYTAWEALTDCDYIEEGYPNAEKWDALLDGAAAMLGKSREEIDAFLAQIPTEN